ncbi:MAG: Gfo/Idh/MocA family oxidoreductase [Armatimonadota bacterium]
MADIRLGMIGIGGFGKFTLEQYQTIPDTKITMICGTHPEKYARLAKEYHIPHYTVDWHELVTSPEVDIVYIATPPNLHAPQGIAAAAAGKHVFLEKPLTLTVAEADTLLSIARTNNVKVGINFVMRYSDVYEKLGQVAAAGLLGKPTRFDFENNAGDLPAGHWFWDPAKSGGIPVEHGVHFFDIYAAIFGRGQFCWAGRTLRENGVADKWLIAQQYGPQMFGTFYNAFDKPSVMEHTWSEIEFQRGRIRLDGWIPTTLTCLGLIDEEEAGRLAEIFPNADIRALESGRTMVLADGNEVPVTHTIHAEFDAGEKQAVYGRAVRAAMVDFINWVQIPNYQPRVTGEDGRNALAVAQQAVDFTEEQGEQRKAA